MLTSVHLLYKLYHKCNGLLQEVFSKGVHKEHKEVRICTQESTKAGNTLREVQKAGNTLSEVQASQYKVKGGLYIVSDN